MSTNDNSTYSQFQPVPASGSSSDNKSDADSSGPASDLVGNSVIFWAKLRDLLQDSGRMVKIPNVGGEILDLRQLFVEVTNRGGIKKVIMDSKCEEVIGTFNLKTKVTNAAYVLRKTYLKMLFEFEHVYFSKEPMSSFWAREEELKRLVAESENHDIDPSKLQHGTLLKGCIDGEFENGYLVTMKTGSHDLRGVIYRDPETKPTLPQYQRLEREYAGEESSLSVAAIDATTAAANGDAAEAEDNL